MVVSRDTVKADMDNSSTGSVIGDDDLACKMDHAANNQLTVSTIITFSGELPDDVPSSAENGVVKVESLYNGNSLESVKSIASEESEDRPLIKEKWYTVAIQVFIPFMLAGAGTIGAGIILGKAEDLAVFKDVKALYVLVPALLGLKGNLDMCLASRLSTQANLGNMEQSKEVIKMIVGNVALVQVQAIVAANLVAIFAIVASGIVNGHFAWHDALLLGASSVLTATLSCFTLDFVLIAVIVLSHKFKLNPDNLATPLAASIGDVVSLTVLSAFATLLFEIHDEQPWILIVILCVYVFIVLPLWIWVVRKNKYTKEILTHGWTPVLLALVISGSGGLVLDQAVGEFDGYGTFQPIVNGIGGNLVSVQASRLATMLHQTSLKGVIPPHTKQWVAPWTALFGGVLPAKTARILIGMCIPGQIIFVFVADLINNDGVSTVGPAFVFTYLAVGVIQVMILLYVAHLMIHTLWRYKVDPDNSSIPILTALGDLLGSTLLLLAFMFLRAVHQEYTPLK